MSILIQFELRNVCIYIYIYKYTNITYDMCLLVYTYSTSMRGRIGNRVRADASGAEGDSRDEGPGSLG